MRKLKVNLFDSLIQWNVNEYTICMQDGDFSGFDMLLITRLVGTVEHAIHICARYQIPNGKLTYKLRSLNLNFMGFFQLLNSPSP